MLDEGGVFGKESRDFRKFGQEMASIETMASSLLLINLKTIAVRSEDDS
jgi:hypothetical protein